MCIAVAGLFTMSRPVPEISRALFSWLVTALLVWIGYNGLAAILNGAPAAVQRSTKRFILSLILLDACIASTAGPPAAALTAALLAPTMILARAFRVT
jgi:hypothetical protein